MARLVWNPTALDDLQRQAEYIRLHSPARKQLFIGNMVAKAEQLREFPCSEQLVTGLPRAGEFRTLLVAKHHRLLYAVTADDNVTILQVLGGRSDQPFFR